MNVHQQISGNVTLCVESTLVQENYLFRIPHVDWRSIRW